MLCLQCGDIVKKGATFCSGCGKRMVPMSAQRHQEDYTPAQPPTYHDEYPPARPHNTGRYAPIYEDRYAPPRRPAETYPPTQSDDRYISLPPHGEGRYFAPRDVPVDYPSPPSYDTGRYAPIPPQDDNRYAPSPPQREDRYIPLRPPSDQYPPARPHSPGRPSPALPQHDGRYPSPQPQSTVRYAPMQPAEATPPPPAAHPFNYPPPSQDERYASVPPPKPKKSPVKAVVIIGLIAVTFIVVGFIIFRNHDNQGYAGNMGADYSDPAYPADDEAYPTGYSEYDTESPPYYEDNEINGIQRSQRFPFPGAPLTRHSDNEVDIVVLHTALIAIRNHYTSIRPIEGGGNFGGATRGAVIDFQVRANLPPTGVVDELTWYAIMDVFENPPQEPDPPFVPTIDAGYVTLVNLHLREGPSQATESLGIKPEGTLVWVISYIPADRWFFVSTEDGVNGYMKAEFLLLDGILP